MSKFTLLIGALVFAFTLQVEAQIQTPAASPKSTFTQVVGLTTISGEYSRPGIKGRTIFAVDGLVPFGKIWRTGANSATKLSFSDDVKVAGQDLAAGDYAILTVPNATSWEVQFHAHESSNWSSYRDKEPTLSVNVDVYNLPDGVQLENFTIHIGEIKSNTCTIEFLWDQTLVAVPVEVEVDARVMKNIEDVLAGPSAGDYYTAGTYFYNSGKDLNKALKYIQKATHTDNPRFWQVRMESEVLAKLGRYKEAVAAAEKSKTLATEAGNNDYIKINSDNIAKWSGM